MSRDKFKNLVGDLGDLGDLLLETQRVLSSLILFFSVEVSSSNSRICIEILEVLGSCWDLGFRGSRVSGFCGTLIFRGF